MGGVQNSGDASIRVRGRDAVKREKPRQETAWKNTIFKNDIQYHSGKPDDGRSSRMSRRRLVS